MADGHQTLYRRYRSQRFGELIGQDHVVRALRNAVANGSYGHAYLFSGQRGTGKTSTARILAKALNCPNVVDGEPCGVCPTCVSIADGTSFDVHELDAASNNGVDAIRDLIERAALGSPGRTKVYILDEVHMLSKGAEAALLKTLEEPPGHVVFVLATTDPQKVSATIRSRCQPFDFHLISSTDLERHVRFIVADAGLEVTDGAIEAVLRRGGGSARDTLSALDQVVASGGVAVDEVSLDELIESLISNDMLAALTALAVALDAGRDVQTLTSGLIAQLRDGFLSLQAPGLVRLSDAAAQRVADQARRLGSAGVVRSMEVLGQSLIDMRHAPDPRVMLEVALVRLTHVELDPTPAALLERIERLERGAPTSSRSVEAAPKAVVTPEAPAPRAAAVPPAASAPASAAPAGARGPAEARAALGAMKSARPAAAPPPARSAAPAPAAAAIPTPSVAPAATGPVARPRGAGVVDLAMVQAAWSDTLLATLGVVTRGMYAGGAFVECDGTNAVFSVSGAKLRDRCAERQGEVEAALAKHFGTPFRLRLVADDARKPSPGPSPRQSAPDGAPWPEEESIDLDDLVDAPSRPTSSGLDLLTAAFPGAEVIDEELR